MDALNLAKEQAGKVALSLEKRGLRTLPKMRVGADLDVSGSMNMTPYRFYDRGVVEQIFQRLIGFALTFDDNGEIDTWAFDDRVHELPTAKARDFGSYVGSNITKRWNRYGQGTRYAPPIKANVDFFFPEGGKKSGLGGLFGGNKAPTSQEPALVLFFTDGDASDHREAGAIMKKAWDNNTPVYFHLIGIGTATSFDKLKWLADEYDNCGFLHMPSIEMTDEQMYDALATTEFLAFLRKHGAA